MGIEQELPQTSTQFSGVRQPRISLVDRDFATIRRALIDLIRVRFPNEWKDFEVSGIGMVILEIVAYSHAQLSFYVDAHANEFFIPTARTFGGMRRLTAALNYRMRSGTAAGVALTAFPNPPNPGKIRLDEGTILRAKNGTVWQLATTTIIPENSQIFPDPDSPGTDLVLAVEGDPRNSRFTSDGSAFQKFLLPDESVVEGSIVVEIDGKTWTPADSLVFSEGFGDAVDRLISTGLPSISFTLTRLYPRADNFVVTVGNDAETAEIWEQVDSLTGSGPADNHYLLTIDSNTGVSVVEFGDGVNGRIPPVGETIVFTYNVIGPQERYQITLEPDGLISIRFGDGNGAVIPAANAEILVDYRVGGGLRGNIEIAGIDTSIQGRLVATNEPIDVRIQNQESGAGAENAETVDHARLFAPKVAASTGRASTQDDYDGLLNSLVHSEFGAAAFGKADLHSDFPESNQVDIVLWTRDAEGRIFPAPEAFREAFTVLVEARADICHYLRHKGGDTIYVDLFADIAIRSTLEVSRILDTVRQAILTFFASTQVLPGVDIRLSQLLTVIQSIAGVSYVTITRLRLSRRSRFVYFLGDGVQSRFRTETFFGFDADLGAPVIPGTFQILVNDDKITDNLLGGLIGDVGTSMGAANAIVYDDVFREVSTPQPGTAGPRFFTPFFRYKRFVINSLPETSIGPVILPDSDFATIFNSLIITDGVQFVYDDGVGAFLGDTDPVSPPAQGSILNVGGEAVVTVSFAAAATGPIVAYYLAKIPEAVFDGTGPNPFGDQKEVAALAHPVRPGTVVIRHDQDLVVDDEDGNFVWNQNATDTRVDANKIIYRDEVVTGESIAIWLVPLTGGLRYQGRLREVPHVPVLSPQLRPGNILLSDGTNDIQDDQNGNLVGGLVDATGVNRVFYEDTLLTNEVIADSGSAAYVGLEILPNVKRPPVHGAPATIFRIDTEILDTGVFKAIVLTDTTGGGVLSASGPGAAFFSSGTVNYATNTVDLTFTVSTTKAIAATYTVLGGTFDLLLLTPFLTTPTATYRKALGGQFDLTYNSTSGGLPLISRHDQALGGHFDVELASIPALNDLVQVDYRFQFQQDFEDEPVLEAVPSGTQRVRRQLANRPVKRGSVVITATSTSGQTMTARDDGGGVFVGASVNSAVQNFIDYTTGVFDVTFSSGILAASQVLADYTSFLEPEEVVPILDDQMADTGTIDLTHIEPRDIK